MINYTIKVKSKIDTKGTFELTQHIHSHTVPITHQEQIPGLQHQMPDKKPVNDQLPTPACGYQTYLAAGKPQGRKALITGGDSGIGRAVAILYAMEGAESVIETCPKKRKTPKTHSASSKRKSEKCTSYQPTSAAPKPAKT